MDAGTRLRLADDFVRRLAASLRGTQLYAPGHPLVQRSLGALTESAGRLLADEPTIAMGLLGPDIVVGDMPLPRAAENFAELIKRLQGLGIERIAFQRGVTADEIATLVSTLAHPERRPGAAAAGAEPADPLALLGTLTNIRVGRLQVDKRTESSPSDVATIRRLYSDAVSMAETVWETAQQEGIPSPREARTLVDSLAQAVAQNRTALVALTALKEYDNYTFTHMVNVSILTMAQARSVGIDGTLLREFGLAALMHDIGKVRTPTEILNKPDTLTDREFEIIRMHPIDGAEILRRTPDLPALAPVVAFEHHLRRDGTGYPVGLARTSLNVATMLCSIADVYDAMRSLRSYQNALPTDRILAVLQRNDGVQFDQHLVRRFTQVMGIYPAGNLVRLNTGEVAVVTQVYAPDPFRPRVRLLFDAAGDTLPRPVDVDLWEAPADGPGPSSVRRPVDAAEFGIDPLVYL
jgi:putative nucleotidyltransferase with HDIG domain